MSFAHAWKCLACRGKEDKLFSHDECLFYEAGVNDGPARIADLNDDVLGQGQEPSLLLLHIFLREWVFVKVPRG